MVDDVFEASVAFDMIGARCTKKLSNDKMEEIIEGIVYDLPYVIERRSENPKLSTVDILTQMEKDLKNKDRNVVRTLCKKIETAFLNSEIERMYGRLEKTGRDIAAVSHKLANLKKRYKIAEKN